MKIAIIGQGAIGRYVWDQLQTRGIQPCAIIVRPERCHEDSDGLRFCQAEDLPNDLDLVVDCAGHAALAEHGPAILLRGIDLITLSIGALADQELHNELAQAAQDGQARLHLASGAIGALDCLRAAQIGRS